MVIANYRREIGRMERKNLIDKYKKLRDASGGLFTSSMRRRLLGIKQESSKQYKEDTPDFWYDVRTTVRNGLKDLELICEIAHPQQLEEIFRDTLSKEEAKELQHLNGNEHHEALERFPSLLRMIRALFRDYMSYKKVKNPYDASVYTKAENIEKDDAWRASLANEITKICLEFYKEHRLVTSKAHTRLVEEIEDMLDVELGNAHMLSRDKRGIRIL